MVQHAGETRDLQSATVFPRILPFSCTWKSIAFVKACVRHFLQKGHCSNLIFGAEHIGFLDSKKWSSPVQVDVCAILPAFRGFIVSGELLKQLGAFRVSSRENSETNTKRGWSHTKPKNHTNPQDCLRHNTPCGIAKALISKLTREAVCWWRATKENWWRTCSPMSRHPQQQNKQSKNKQPKQHKNKTRTTHKRGMTGYEFIGRFMQEVTTLCHLIMVWPQTNKRGEHQETQGHTRRWEKQHSTMRKPGIPPARSQDASRNGITTHQWSLRSKQRRRRVPKFAQTN